MKKYLIIKICALTSTMSERAALAFWEAEENVDSRNDPYDYNEEYGIYEPGTSACAAAQAEILKAELLRQLQKKEEQPIDAAEYFAKRPKTVGL